MNAIQRVVWKSESRAGRVFETVVLSVIVGGLVVDGIVTLESLGPRVHQALVLASTVVTTLFVTD